jgi:hypothetical protein
MQKDFHYYCIAVLAKAAGFNKEDALTIAYASQYVDNLTESEPIRVGELMFDPVRTAHMGLKAFDWGVQKRVYIPFHFIPPEVMTSSAQTYDFVTKPSSRFAMMIFKEACRERTRLDRLCRIGVALHTLADTWSHQGFSGRQHGENDVERISIHTAKGWKHLFWENIALDLLPQIGHAEAGDLSDRPFQKWEYTRGSTGEVVERDNKQEFMTAAKVIYDRLCEADKADPEPPVPWEEIEKPIAELLALKQEDVDERCGEWEKRFASWFSPSTFKYYILKWRDEALKPGEEQNRDEWNTNWDPLPPSDFARLRFPMKKGFYDSRWVRFHAAAMRQRHFVLEYLP